MKKLFFLTATITLILSACGINESLSLSYNGSDYSPVSSWYLIDESREVVEVLKDNKKSDAFLYTASDNKFILAETGVGDVLFHKVSDILPSFENNASVEKIVIDFYDENMTDITLQGDDLKTFTEDIKSYDDKKLSDSEVTNLGVVDVYYSDYPAYYFCGHIVKTSDGKSGFYKLDSESSGKINECILLSDQDII